MIKRFAFITALCAALLAAQAGCSLFQKETVKPSFPTEDKKIVVIPFAEPPMDFFESRLGELMATEFKQLVGAKNPGLKFQDPSPASEYLFGVDPSRVSWKKVAELTSADYVLVGNISLFRSKNPRDIGVWKGRSVVQVKLIDASAGRELLDTKVQARYPGNDYETFFGDEEEVLTKLRQITVTKIARYFYEYPAE